MTKGEKLEQRYENAWGEVEDGHGQRGSKKLDMEKEGATLKN